VLRIQHTSAVSRLGSRNGLNAFHVPLAPLTEGASAAWNIDTAWHAPLHDLLKRPVEAGHGDHSTSAQVEVLRKPEQMA
jgi:hypothetical protein